MVYEKIRFMRSNSEGSYDFVEIGSNGEYRIGEVNEVESEAGRTESERGRLSDLDWEELLEQTRNKSNLGTAVSALAGNFTYVRESLDEGTETYMVSGLPEIALEAFAEE